MFTKNYIMYRKMMFDADTYIYMKDYEGGTSNGFYAQYSWGVDFGKYMGTGNVAALGSNGVYFGSGTTPPTRDDYKLESAITSGLKVSNGGVVYRNKGNGTYEISSSFIVQNSAAEGGESITIAEMGYFGKCGYASSKSIAVLFERQVLAVPIVLAPGERKLITYKITINQIFNVD